MKILFVCTGNTCRSCMAEAIFNSMYDSQNVIAYSAGTNAVAGSCTSKNAAQVVFKNLNLDISKRKAVNLNENLIKECDLILAMTKGIRDRLQIFYSSYKSKIYTLSEFVGRSGDVLDPYGGSELVYLETFNSQKELISLLIRKLKEDSSI